MSTMDFFEHQDQARKKTGLLVTYFVLAVLMIMVAVYWLAVLGVTLGGNPENPESFAAKLSQNPFDLRLFFGCGVATLAVVAAGTLFKIQELSAGGSAVATMLGGREVDPQTQNPLEKRLMNVVEEMAIASGITVPTVYILDWERRINAFAAGYEPNTAVIGVTRGCLEYLNRDELQGVIAHEFSHILNGDMRLNLRLIGILHGILLIALLGWILLRTMVFAGEGGGGKKGGPTAALLVVGIGLIIIGGIGLFFGKLIKGAISREREYLADASAVQFTRNPEGISGALRKLGCGRIGSKVFNAHAEEASHMFFGNIAESFFGNFLSTHPPLTARIRRIVPHFDGNYPKRLEKLAVLERPKHLQADRAHLRAEAAKYGFTRRPGTPGKTMPLDPLTAVSRIGTVDFTQLAVAAALLDTIPDPMSQAAREPFGARAVIYSILLDGEAEIRRKQLDILAEKAEKPCFDLTLKLMDHLKGFAPESRLPLVELAIPALRNLSPEQYRRFRENLDALMKADRKIDLFEYTIHAMLLRDLDVHFQLQKRPVVRYHSITPLFDEFSLVLSYLAYAGNEKEEDATRAFRVGLAIFKKPAEMCPKDRCNLKSFDAALKALADASPTLKKRLMTAFANCVAADQKVTPKEGELIRAIAAMLACPIPPFGTAEDAPSGNNAHNNEEKAS